MRGYIVKVEEKEDEQTRYIRPIYFFCEEITGAGWWKTRERAEFEIPLMEGRITMDNTGVVCRDFRVEERSENEFVISCEGPTKAG